MHSLLVFLHSSRDFIFLYKFFKIKVLAPSTGMHSKRRVKKRLSLQRKRLMEFLPLAPESFLFLV